MKPLFYLVMMLPLVGFTQASSGINSGDYRSIQEQQYVDLNNQGKVSLDNIDGTPFLTDEYVEGKIIDTKKDVEVPALLKYNAYLDEFLIQLDDENQNFKLPRVERYEYEYKNKRFTILINDQLFDDTDNKYVVELVNRPGVKLYKQYYVELDPGREPKNSYDSGKRPSFNRNDNFYLKLPDQPIKKLQTDRKVFASQFPAEFSSDLKDFIYDKRLKFKSDTAEFDILRVMRYYLKLKNQ